MMDALDYVSRKKVSVSVSKYLACKGMKENDKEETKQRKAKDIIDTLDIDMDALNIGNHPKIFESSK